MDDCIAIDALCDILDRSPEKFKLDIITWACFSVGLEQERTGLEPTGNRKVGQLYWDFTLDDLKKRLIQLVDVEKLLEEVVVQGVLRHLISFYCDQADPEQMPRIKINHQRMINHLEQELSKDVENRLNHMTDDELKTMIKKMIDSLSNVERNRKNAETVLDYLRQNAEERFTNEFWSELRRLKYGD